MRRLILLLAAMAMIAGCSSTIQGEGSPVRGGSGEVVVDLPPRPRELPLDDLNPCSLLTVAQQAGLGLDGTPSQPQVTQAENLSGIACAFLGSEPRNIGVVLTLVTENGIEALTRPGVVQAEIIPTTVSDFPALILDQPALPHYCLLNIDVAQGQIMNVVFTDDEVPPAPHEEVCAGAKAAAAQALSTLAAER